MTKAKHNPSAKTADRKLTENQGPVRRGAALTLGDNAMSQNLGKPRKASTKHDRNTVAQRRAYAALDPTAQNALTIHAYCKNMFADGEIALRDLVYRLDAQSKALSEGDLEHAEAMLSAQAHTLDTLFNHLAQRATRAEYVRNFELYLKLALKAQSQCRTTLEALAEIKNPASVSFVRQANIAHGHQQVNNQGSSDTNGTARARGKPKSAEQTKQVPHDEQSTLDTAAPGTPSRADPAMATVGAVHGAENGQG